MDPSRLCDHCGKPLPTEGLFCAHCGKRSSAEGASEAPKTARLGPWERILERLRVVTAGRYEVQRLLGWGGMAGVYLAEETRLKRRVAIKVIAPGLLMDPSQIERFEQEARTTAQLNHPNIVTIYEVDEREDLHYFSMTYVPGRSLAQVMSEASAPLPLGVVEAWVRQVASALSYAHQRGVVHRDIKPGNILLDEQGTALVGDFGIAKVAEEPGLTRTGMLVGTPAYMSPEQCTTGKVSGASDQYSLGAVAYQLIAGVPPFEGSTIQVIQAHVAEPPRDVRERRPDCPAQLAEAVMRMLAKAPEDRWESLYDAIDALGGSTLRHDDPVRRSMALLSAWTHEIRIDPPTADADGRSHLEVGHALQLTAATLDYRGSELADRRIEWSLTPDGVAEIDERGRLRGLAEGKVRVVATSGRVSDDWIVTVGHATNEPATPAAGIEAALLNPPMPEATSAEQPSAPEDPPSAPDADPTPAPTEEDAPFEPVGAQSSYPEVMSTAAADAPSAEPSDGAPRPPDSRGAPVRPPEPKPRRPIPLWMPAGGAAVVLAGLAFALTRGGGSAPSTPDAGAPVPEAALAAPPSSASDEGSVDGAPRNIEDTETVADAEGAADETPPDDAASTAEAPPATVPARETAPQPAESRPAPSTRTPAAATTRAPATGVVRVLGDVPADAMVRIRGDGVDRASRERTFELAPGRYDVEVRAPGFAVVATEVTVVAGRNADWRPVLEAQVLEAPTDESPTTSAGDPPVSGQTAASTDTPDPAAERAAAITAAVQAFGTALQSRDPAELRRAWPTISDGDARPWEQFMTSRDVRDLRVTVTVPTVPDGEGDRVTVPFQLRLQYQNPGAPPPSDPIAYQATVERRGERWVLTGLRAGTP